MLSDMQVWQMWLWTATVVFAGIAAGLVVRWILLRAADGLVKGTRRLIDDDVVRALRGPSILILPAFGAQLALTSVLRDTPAQKFLQHLLALVLIAGATWLVISLMGTAGQYLLRRYQRRDRSPIEQRSVETRVHLLSRVLSTIVVVIGAAIMLMTLPGVRELGTSILASAGIAGVVAGLAARSLLANLFAGIQLALTEPIRIGDAVVIDKEFGTVEEIGSSLVIVRLWDMRRLIVPLNYFLENRFENWTLTSSNLLGTVLLYVDHGAPIESLRAELKRLLETSESWDRKVGVLQVTDTTENAIQVRALVSAADPDTLWNLRCEVREKLLAYLHEEHPEALPRRRLESATEEHGTASAEPPKAGA